MPNASLVNIDFAGAAKLLETAAQLVKTVTEAIRDAIKASLDTADLISARKAETRLRNMYLRAGSLCRQQGIFLMPAAEKYITVPTGEHWHIVRRQIESVLNEVEPLLSDLAQERGNFVLEPTYMALVETMKQRQVALEGVLTLPSPPTSPENLEKFKEFLKKYVILIRDLQQLELAVAAYLRIRSHAV